MKETKYYCDRCGKEIGGRRMALKSWVQFYLTFETRYEVLMKEVCADCYKSYLNWLKGESAEE